MEGPTTCFLMHLYIALPLHNHRYQLEVNSLIGRLAQIIQSPQGTFTINFLIMAWNTAYL